MVSRVYGTLDKAASNLKNVFIFILLYEFSCIEEV